MPALSFYNDNANRAYPLYNGDREMLYSGGGNLALPDSLIVDVTILVGHASDYDDADDHVYLYEVEREDDHVYFRFRSSAARLEGYTLEFCRHVDDAEFATSQARVTVSEGDFAHSIDGICDFQLIAGWLVTGPLEDILALLADGEWLRRADGEIYVEPARIQNLSRGYANSINLANADRTRYPDLGCHDAGNSEFATSQSETAQVREYFINAGCLAGPIWWRAGYNCEITQDNDNNQIIIGAGVGAGLGEPCEEIPLYDGEAAPAGSSLLSGGPACHELIKTINGITGPHVLFLAKRGFNITADEDNPHKLMITIDLHGLAVCDGEA